MNIPELRIFQNGKYNKEVLNLRQFCKNIFSFQILDPEKFDEVNEQRLIKLENNPNNIKILAN